MREIIAVEIATIKQKADKLKRDVLNITDFNWPTKEQFSKIVDMGQEIALLDAKIDALQGVLEKADALEARAVEQIQISQVSVQPTLDEA